MNEPTDLGPRRCTRSTPALTSSGSLALRRRAKSTPQRKLSTLRECEAVRLWAVADP
jgi:hypothetical protein